MSTIRIPPVLRAEAGNRKQVEASGETVRAVLDSLVAQYPGLRDQLLDAEGALNRFVNVYLNDQDIRYLQELDTQVTERDTIVVLPAMAGGATAGGGTR
ncbi:MAG: ubiquitin-like small modifier protein 1 [Candidatus Limnocylindrales bacterium]